MCVFKYHAFIYFLRPPPWYGTVIFCRPKWQEAGVGGREERICTFSAPELMCSSGAEEVALWAPVQRLPQRCGEGVAGQGGGAHRSTGQTHSLLQRMSTVLRYSHQEWQHVVLERRRNYRFWVESESDRWPETRWRPLPFSTPGWLLSTFRLQ